MKTRTRIPLPIVASGFRLAACCALAFLASSARADWVAVVSHYDSIAVIKFEALEDATVLENPLGIELEGYESPPPPKKLSGELPARTEPPTVLWLEQWKIRNVASIKGLERDKEGKVFSAKFKRRDEYITHMRDTWVEKHNVWDYENPKGRTYVVFRKSARGCKELIEEADDIWLVPKGEVERTVSFLKLCLEGNTKRLSRLSRFFKDTKDVRFPPLLTDILTDILKDRSVLGSEIISHLILEEADVASNGSFVVAMWVADVQEQRENLRCTRELWEVFFLSCVRHLQCSAEPTVWDGVDTLVTSVQPKCAFKAKRPKEVKLAVELLKEWRKEVSREQDRNLCDKLALIGQNAL